MNKIKELTTYLNLISNRLASETPPKHKHREKQFRDFLNRELMMTKEKIERLRLLGSGKEGGK